MKASGLLSQVNPLPGMEDGWRLAQNHCIGGKATWQVNRKRQSDAAAYNWDHEGCPIQVTDDTMTIEMYKINRTTLLIVLLAVLLLVASCTGSQVVNPSPPTSSGFAYVSNMDEEGELQIYLMNLDGTDLGRMLPTSENNKLAVACSYDMNRYAFIDFIDVDPEDSDARQFLGQRFLKTMDKSQGAVETLFQNDEIFVINMSGNGQKIVFQLIDIDNWASSVHGVNYDGTGNHFIFGDQFELAAYPNISNDGSRVVYSIWTCEEERRDGRQAGDGIYVSPWNGGTEPELLVADTETQVKIFPALSPDNTKLAYVIVDYDLEAFLLMVVDLNGMTAGEPRELYRSDDFISDLRYSADGTRLLFSNMPVQFFKGGRTSPAFKSIPGARLSRQDEISIFSIDALNGGNLRQYSQGESWNFFNFLLLPF